jgi:alpha-1,2-mannosyltransferase
VFEFQNTEIPRLLNISGLLPVYPPGTPEEDIPLIDLSPVKEFDLKLCMGKEWHRFPGSYLIPNGIRVEFVKSEFDGMLPRHFEEKLTADDQSHGQGGAIPKLANSWWLRPQTTYVPLDLNDLNKEDVSHYVPVDECDYLIDLDFPLHPVTSTLEPRYATMTDTWERVSCHPFLDVRHSLLLTRIFWLPGKTWQSQNEFGDFCLLKNRKRVEAKEVEVARRVDRSE